MALHREIAHPPLDPIPGQFQERLHAATRPLGIFVYQYIRNNSDYFPSHAKRRHKISLEFEPGPLLPISGSGLTPAGPWIWIRWQVHIERPPGLGLSLCRVAPLFQVWRGNSDPIGAIGSEDHDKRGYPSDGKGIKKRAKAELG